jgi:hypothetical protein
VTVLHVCAERGFDIIARIIVEKSPELLFELDEKGNSPLHVAAEWDFI